MDNYQNNGQPVEGQGFVQPQMQQYGQPQQGFEQPQMQQYGQPQQGFEQPQMQQYGQPQMQSYGQPQYQNVQQPYGQPQYQNVQQPYGQPQYQNVQQPYGQQQAYNQQMYANSPQGYGGGPAPKKPIVINKKIIIIAVALLAVILAVIFIPKLFKKSEPPFEDVKLGLTMDEVVERYKIKEKDAHGMDAYKDNVEGFGVEGNLQFCFSDDTLYMVNWYVYDYNCSEEDMDKAVDEAKEYYTEELGEPEKEDNSDFDEIKYVWEYGDGAELELVIGDGYIILRVVDFSLI